MRVFESVMSALILAALIVGGIGIGVCALFVVLLVTYGLLKSAVEGIITTPWGPRSGAPSFWLFSYWPECCCCSVGSRSSRCRRKGTYRSQCGSLSWLADRSSHSLLPMNCPTLAGVPGLPSSTPLQCIYQPSDNFCYPAGPGSQVAGAGRMAVDCTL